MSLTDLIALKIAVAIANAIMGTVAMVGVAAGLVLLFGDLKDEPLDMKAAEPRGLPRGPRPFE